MVTPDTPRFQAGNADRAVGLLPRPTDRTVGLLPRPTDAFTVLTRTAVTCHAARSTGPGGHEIAALIRQKRELVYVPGSLGRKLCIELSTPRLKDGRDS